jgi:hypothetical protein
VPGLGRNSILGSSQRSIRIVRNRIVIVVNNNEDKALCSKPARSEQGTAQSGLVHRFRDWDSSVGSASG